MATYTELRQLFSDDELRNKVTTACIIAAHELLSGTPTAADKAFAETVFSSPDAVGDKILMAVLAANKDATVSGIQGATDSAIQTAVDAVIPAMVDAMAGV